MALFFISVLDIKPGQESEQKQPRSLLSGSNKTNSSLLENAISESTFASNHAGLQQALLSAKNQRKHTLC